MAKVVRLTCSCGRRVGKIVMPETTTLSGVVDICAGKGEGGKCKKWTCGQNYRAHIAGTILGSLLLAVLLFFIQAHFEQNRADDKRKDERMSSFRWEFKDFNQQAGKMVLATLELAAAEEDYNNGKEADKAQLMKAFDTARNKQNELPNFIGSCKSLRTYLRTKESLDALEKLEKAFDDLFASSTREAADGAIRKLNIHWDDFMKTMDAEFAYKD
jgi:hypothetical protein